jgi:hypothetical protein
MTSEGWDEAIPQAATIGDFIGHIEARTFRFEFGER